MTFSDAQKETRKIIVSKQKVIAACKQAMKEIGEHRHKLFELEVQTAMKPIKRWFRKPLVRTRKEAEKFVCEQADGGESWQIAAKLWYDGAEQLLKVCNIIEEDQVELTGADVHIVAQYTD